MTIFCPSCGTANRDDSEMCSECGNIIPKLGNSQPSEAATPAETATPSDFGIYETYTPPPPADNPSSRQDFNIDVAYPPPPPDQTGASYPSVYPPYDGFGARSTGQRNVCDRCGTVLRPDDSQCSGCGKPNQVSASLPPPPSDAQPSPYAPPPPQRPSPTDIAHPSPPPPKKALTKPKPDAKVAKCAKCGAIVYDYETKCNNCGRILAAPTKKPLDPTKDMGKAPPGTARCSRCNAVVYPHQTACPNCQKQLAPVTSTPRGPSQRITRCKRCGSTVYPTDTRCKNCGRSLDPI